MWRTALKPLVQGLRLRAAQVCVKVLYAGVPVGARSQSPAQVAIQPRLELHGFARAAPDLTSQYQDKQSTCSGLRAEVPAELTKVTLAHKHYILQVYMYVAHSTSSTSLAASTYAMPAGAASRVSAACAAGAPSPLPPRARRTASEPPRAASRISVAIRAPPAALGSTRWA